MSTNAHHKEVTIYKVVVRFGDQKPRIASAKAIDKGGDCYWCPDRPSDFGFNVRIPKAAGTCTTQKEAVSFFVDSQYQSARALRSQADIIESMAKSAESLLTQ